jgi:CheY-like chemotaxis protein
MRPKHTILCYDSNEQELSVMKFTLEIHRYKVLCASTPSEAIALYASCPDIRVALIADYSKQVRGWMTGKELLGKLKGINPRVALVLLRAEYSPDAEIFADALVSKHDCPMQRLLEYIRTLGAAKRGPKKGWRAALAAAV